MGNYWIKSFLKAKGDEMGDKGKRDKGKREEQEKASTHQRRNESKKKIKRNRFRQMEDKRKTKKGSGYDICY
jgi:hypothetical protein